MKSFGNVKESAGFEQAPAGTYAGRLLQALDLGTQETTFGPKRKVLLAFETAKPMEDGRPYLISRWLNLSLFRTSGFREFVESWLGRELTTDERRNFNFEALLTKPALLTVMHKPNAQGESKALIHSISPMPDGLEAPPLVNKQLVFDLADPDPESSAFIAQITEDMIRRSPKFATSGLDGKTPPPDRSGGDDDLGVA